MMGEIKISIVVLTYNRFQLLRSLLRSLQEITYKPLEIVVVDNASDEMIPEGLETEFSNVQFLRMSDNMGTTGRNRGIASTSGEIIVTIDDDIFGLTDDHLTILIREFSDPKIGAVCFKVIDPDSNEIVNWCHHYPVEKFLNTKFITNEITEGAVAFKKSTLQKSGVYPESFFISHEGPDLACRILDNGDYVTYCPDIVVKHFHSHLGRNNWRRYYFDTRNLLWLALRNYPFFYGFKFVSKGVFAMFIYSIRDGYLKYWLTGIIDSLKGGPEIIKERSRLSCHTMELIREIEQNRPSILSLARKRLFRRGVRI